MRQKSNSTPVTSENLVRDIPAGNRCFKGLRGAGLAG